jgi:hypothetical protein
MVNILPQLVVPNVNSALHVTTFNVFIPFDWNEAKWDDHLKAFNRNRVHWKSKYNTVVSSRYAVGNIFVLNMMTFKLWMFHYYLESRCFIGYVKVHNLTQDENITSYTNKKIVFYMSMCNIMQ